MNYKQERDALRFVDANGMSFRGDHTSGFQLVCSTGHPVTQTFDTMSELEAEISNNGEAIRIASHVIPPSEETIARYIASLDKTVARIEEAKTEYARKFPKLKSLVAQALGGVTGEVYEAVSKAVSNIPRHLAEIDRARQLAAEAPSRLVLPLGATVRLKKDWDIPEYSALDPNMAWALVFRPAAGSVGVVIGNCIGSQEASLAVAFPDGAETTNGLSGKHYEEHLALSRSMLVSDVEVLEYGTYLDGTICLSPDVVTTHAEVYDADDIAKNMILHIGDHIMVAYADSDPFDEGVHFRKSTRELENLVDVNELESERLAP